METLSTNEESSDSMIDSSEKADVHASHVYVVMKKKTRVSRNLRACWFFRHLCKSVKFTPLSSLENLPEDLNLVSVVPQDEDQKLEHGKTYYVFIGPDTVVTFLSSQYRLAFTLDLSPSLMSVDVHNGHYVFDGIFESLKNCLHGLVMPLPIPGSNITFSPDLYISVTIQTPVICSNTNQVLIQGVMMNQSNIDFYLRHIQAELEEFEAALSVSFATLLKKHRKKESFFYPEEDETDENDSQNLEELMGSPEAAFTNLLRYGILSLQLLPSNSSSGIVVITDGIVGLPSSDMMELLLGELRSHTIMCSFIKVGSPSGLYHKLAHVPHMELMRDIATATFGAFLAHGPDVSEEPGEANLYHRAMMFWSFQRGLEGFKYDLTHYSDEDMAGSISWIKRMLYRHPLTGEMFGTDVQRQKAHNRTVVAGLGSVLSVRLREGYTIKNVTFQNDNKEILVKLQFPWRDDGKIEYAARSSWPIDTINPSTQIEVAIEGSYELLHEILCVKTSKTKSSYRVNNIKNLCRIVDSIATTDRMLEHLQSFSSNPVYYQIPEGIRHGVPLFSLQQDVPHLNTQLNTRQKWMHSHRIGLVLEHDRQLPKYFQVPNASSRFASIACRQSFTSLGLFLHKWSTFVLVESHSYIKFLYCNKDSDKDKDKAPMFFCLLRLTSKPPSMIIRLGFLGGTPASVRNEELKLLRQEMSSLHFPQRGSQKTTKKMTSSTGAAGKEEPSHHHKSPLNKEGSEIACCILWEKPVDKILVVYENKPADMSVLSEPIKESCIHHEQWAMWSVFRTVTHYLQHQRWVWNIQASNKIPVSMQAISRILSTITKLRLQEGFHVIVSSGGVTNLVLEVDMKDDTSAKSENESVSQTCVIQYIIFPPHVRTTDNSASEEDLEEMGTAEADGEVQIVTECWVEPQYGVCYNNPKEREYFDGLNYENIAKAFHPHDYECVSSLSTFEHLVYLCENTIITTPDVTSGQSSPPSSPGQPLSRNKEETGRSEPTVNFIPFLFDLLSILPRSQQAEILFSTFVIGDGSKLCQETVLDPKEPNELLFSLFFDKLRETHKHVIPLSPEDCHRFTSHIIQRPRNKKTNPIPFAFRPSECFEPKRSFSSTSTNESKLFSTGSKRQGAFNDGRESSPGSSARTAGATHPNYFNSSGSGYNRGFSGRHHRSSMESSPRSKGMGGGWNATSSRNSRQSDSFYGPKWKCFLKMDAADHIFLTFVPASFDDLLSLNPSSVQSSMNSTVESETDDEVGLSKPTPATPERHATEQNDQQGESASACDANSESPSASTKTDTAGPRATSLRLDGLNEQVPEGVNRGLRTPEPATHGALLIPVYVYSCQLKNITSSLIDRWTFTLPEDIYEDMTFRPDPVSDQKSPRSPRGNMQSFPAGDEEQEDRGQWKNSVDRRSTDSNSFRIETFREECCSLADMFFTAFVCGVYQSLQNDYNMDAHDVDAAITRICEESHPLEMDMTTYLLASCSHVQDLVSRARVNLKISDDSGILSGKGERDRRLSVRFQDNPSDIRREEDWMKIPEILQLPATTVTIDESTLQNMNPEYCKHGPDCHSLIETIRAKFDAAISQFFKPVQSLPEFYYFCPSRHQLSQGENDVKDTMDKSENPDVVTENDDDAVDIVMSNTEDRCEMGEDDHSMDSNHLMSSSLDSLDDHDYTLPCDRGPMPLFIHFTCTIKQKSNFQHTSITRVPLCFGEITSELSEPLTSLDLSDLKVTLDINCLSLLEDEDQPMPSCKPFFSRTMSLASQEQEDVEEKDSTVLSTSLAPIGDTLGHLSRQQHSAIHSLKEEIQWLMEEEVISALRSMHPINVDVLTFVSEHIMLSSSQNQETSMYQNIDLQFVYGSDQSHHMFIEEFERQKLPGYRLTREGEFYFVIINKSEAHQYRYNQQINRAVQHLDMIVEGSLERPHRIMMPEDRSLSLPCIYRGNSEEQDASILPVSRSQILSRHDSSGPQSLELFPPQENLKGQTQEEMTTEKTCEKQADVLENPQVPELFSKKPLSREESLLSRDASIKKSNSFAGLHGSQTRSPSLSRHRHRSAPNAQTNASSRPSTNPQSPSIISSRNSTTYDGFDGDVSDNDIDEMASVSDISMNYQELPDFWLLVRAHIDKIDIFFHSRDSIMDGCPVNSRQKTLFQSITNNIPNVCRKVNQILLLRDLNKTRVCNSLLVPEADEDFLPWASRRTISGRGTASGFDAFDEDDADEGQSQGYLAASMNLKPGFFACDVVLHHLFYLHSRLKQPSKRGGPPRGVVALRNILNKFAVSNRGNMFVIEELSKQNVFYVRLKEIQMPRDCSEIDLDASLSDSTHLTSLKSEGSGSRHDVDAISVSSTSQDKQGNRMDNYVELTVHGIEEAGKQIKHDLMSMLQKKLDEALLEYVSGMLARNPQGKLNPSDISFIQRPGQEPAKMLRLTIPGHCSPYLVAIMYYLRQNLLQFLHTPNYMDTSNTAGQFQDIYDGVWSPIPTHKVYIYNNQHSGPDIACISVNLVDGQGRQVKLLSCPCPVRYNSSTVSDPSEFASLVHTAIHEQSGSSRPGPTALIQFRIWQCGSCSLESLCDRLIGSVRHSLCDVIMEYFVLTSPICRVPPNLLDAYTPPSLPASPVKIPAAASQEKQHNLLSRKFSIDPPKSGNQPDKPLSPLLDSEHAAKSESVGKFLDFFTEPPTDQSSLPRTPLFKGASANSGESIESQAILHTLAKYESGEEGNLHPVFSSLIEPWLNFCRSAGVPSVSKATFHVQAKFAVDFVLKELQQSVLTICHDTPLKVFKVIPASSVTHQPFGVLFTPCRKYAQNHQMNTLLERLSAGGGKVKVMGIGRPMDQWHAMVHDKQDTQPTISPQILKAMRGNQKFLPQVPMETDSSKTLDLVDTRSGEKYFVPRQKLLIITCDNKELNLFLYNWGGDLANQVEKIVTRLVQWNNARCHVLDSIMAQKMGLFHHFAFSDLHYSMAQNPYTQSSAEVESLIRNHAPPREYQRRHSSLSSKEKDRVYAHTLKRIIPFDQTFKGLHPPKVTERIFSSLTSDPVCRHGMQAQELRMLYRQPEEERSKLCQLYRGWCQGNWKAHANHPVMEDYLIQLKRAGRLFHYCATPLVFSQRWRQNVVQKTVRRGQRNLGDSASAVSSGLNPSGSIIGGGGIGTASNSAATTPATPDKSQRTRSRHSSGASNVSTKGKGAPDLGEISRKGSLSDTTSTGGKGKPEPEEEEPWHIALCQRFMGEYKGYLVSELGFVPLIVQPSLGKSTEPKMGLHHADTVNLQKTLAGGIILIELSFRQEYFCINMFAIDCLQLQVNVNQQMHLIFIDECDKYKDLIHAHSFAHDFHLSCVQAYLRKEEICTFPPRFDLGCFLSDFKQIFPYPPSFSRNCLKEDSISLRELPFPGLTLYQFMLKQTPSLDMNVFQMGDMFALVHLEQLDIANMSREVDDASATLPESYLSCLVITNDCERQGVMERDSRTLHLKFFTVLTRQRDCYPIQTLEKAFGELRGNQRKAFYDELYAGKPMAVKQHIGMRKEHINYRGYCNFQQHNLYKSLKAQSEKGKSKIDEMVQMSELQCRKDFLWGRLLCSDPRTEDKRNLNDTDDSEESVRNPLTYEEFRELLQSVTSLALNDHDPQLNTLFNMPTSWYLSLYNVLKLKYPDTHRCFTSPDNLTKYIVILNRNDLDMFAMMSVNESNGQVDLCVVMKEPLADEAHHSPNTPNPTLYGFQTHIEDFVDVCCYHVWASII